VPLILGFRTIREQPANCFAAIQDASSSHASQESFDVVGAFLQQARAIRNVVAIHRPLTALRKDARIVRRSSEAAAACKSVTALSNSRHDSETKRANIRWSAISNVRAPRSSTYSIELKTHASFRLVVRVSASC